MYTEFNTSKREFIHFSTYAIALSFVIGFTGVWVLPDIVSNIIKPIVAMTIMLDSILGRHICVSTYSKIIFAFIFVVTVSNIITGAVEPMILLSMLVNLYYLLLIISLKYNNLEFKFISRALKYASLLLGVSVMLSNPLIGTISSSNIYLLQYEVNKNAVPYLIAPGLFIAVDEIGKKKSILHKIIIFIEIIVLSYAGVYPMSRGGLLCIALPLCLVGIHRYINAIKKIKIGYVITRIMLLTIFLGFIVSIMPEQYVNRLFVLDNYSYHNSSGRDLLINQAIELASGHELLGRGIGYYQQSLNRTYGSHNCFVDIYVACGILGVICFIMIFLYPLIKTIKTQGYCWVAMAIVAAFFESQLSYQVWTPLIMSWIIWRVRVDSKKEVSKYVCVNHCAGL